MKPYVWMVKYTPQRAWIERRGIIIWLSMYFGILGGGGYLVSLYFNNLAAMFMSWLIVLIIKSGLHVAHTENPMKLWRMFLRPQTSWISRGLILTVSFVILGAVQLALTYWAPGNGAELAFKILAGIAAFGVMIYAGFTLSYVSGIPFWNAAILPMLFIVWGITSGLTMLLVTGSGTIDIKPVIGGNVIMLAAAIVLIVLYLWTETYAGPANKESVKELTRGLMVVVWGMGVFVIGLIIPLIISVIGFFSGSMSPAANITIFICQVIGGLAFTYGVLKVGVYSPLIASKI